VLQRKVVAIQGAKLKKSIRKDDIFESDQNTSVANKDLIESGGIESKTLNVKVGIMLTNKALGTKIIMGYMLVEEINKGF